MNTRETYVSFETAKLLKEAGFDWECFGYFNVISPQNVEQCISIYPGLCNAETSLKCPTLDVAQRWLREVKNIYMYVDILSREKDTNFYEFSFIVWYLGKMYPYIKYFTSYEEALEAGIKRCLELILKEK